MSTLIATDLDQTLIYSSRAIARHGGDRPVTAVEVYQGADASFMTTTAADLFADLYVRALVIPTTTRTPEQLARVRLPGVGHDSGYAVAANGGILLIDGSPDRDWHETVRTQLRDVTSLVEVSAHVEAVCRPEWTKLTRTASDLFCYAVVDREKLPVGFAEAESHWAEEQGWQVSLQGRKLYWVPRPLTKSAAIAEVARRTGATSVLAAGDSLLDADLLLAADAGIAARHGELVTSGWQAPHVTVTWGEGIAAGEEIVRWFGDRLAHRD